MKLAFGHIQVFAPDLDAARSFYAGVLGLELAETHDGMLRYRGSDFVIDIFKCDTPSGVDGYSQHAGSSVSFRVASVEQAMQALRDKGVNVLHEVPNTASDGTRYAAFADPFGTVFELIEPAPPRMG